ncbi:MAG: hypothetical protein WAW03_17240 [Anaerolineae bacterium]
MTILYDIFTQIARINFIWPAGSYLPSIQAKQQRFYREPDVR